MFTTQDYLGLSPWEALIQMVNDVYRKSLNPHTTELTRLIKGAGNQVTVELSTHRSTSDHNLTPPISRDAFNYWRLDLGVYFSNLTLDNVTVPCSTSDLVAQLSQQTGIVFDDRDFIYHDIHPTPVVLEAGPDSLRWVGSVPVTLSTMDVNLSTVTNVELINTLPLPGSLDKIQGPFYSSAFDFSKGQRIFKGLEVGEHRVSGDWIDRFLRPVTGDQWVCSSTPQPWNIACTVVDGVGLYKVLYNGPVVSSFSNFKDRGGSILVLELDDVLCTNISGYLTLHY